MNKDERRGVRVHQQFCGKIDIYPRLSVVNYDPRTFVAELENPEEDHERCY